MLKYFFIRQLQKFILFKNNLQNQSIIKYSLKGNEKILFIKLDRIGDACWTIKQSKILKKFFPNTKIYILANNYNKWVFDKFKNLFEKIYTIDTTPPKYILKNPYGIISDPLNTWINNINTIKLIPKKFDFIINQTNRNAFLIEKLLIGKKIKCKIHKEIGAKYPWCGTLEYFIDTNKLNYNFKLGKIKKVLLFKGGKYPHKLSENFWGYIIHFFKKQNLNFDLLYDYQIENNLYLTLKNNGFFVKNETLENFIKKYDLIIGPDGGVMHYIGLFRPTLIILTATNLFSIDYVKQIDKFGNRKLYKSLTGNNYYMSKNLPCVGCFQLGCEKLYCHNIYVREIEGILNKIIKQKGL